MVQSLPPRADGYTLDLDSTVFERYGRQEGSLKGYNPRKHGRPSHHPLLAILAEAKLVQHAWLRSGNTASARGVIAFLAETLAKLPDDFRLYALRADAGFFVTEFLVELERRTLPYVIAVRMNPHLRRTVAGSSSGRLSPTVWKPRRPAIRLVAGRPRAGWWWCAKPSANGPRRAGANCSRSPAILFMSWSPPLGMTRCRPGASTTAAPRAKTASRNSSRTLAPTASACTPSMAPKPLSA